MEKIFTFTSIFSAIAPILTGAIALKKRTPKGPFFIFILVLTSFSLDFGSYLFAKTYGYNYWIINIYFFLELLILVSFFHHELPKKLIVLLIGLGLGTILGYHFLINGFHSRPATYNALNNLIQIFFSLWLYYYMFQQGTDIFIENSFLFWANTGILVYFSGSLFTIILGNEILSNPSLTWTFHNLANILKNILFAIGLWKVRAAV